MGETMLDINRLNELYAATTQGDWQRCHANGGTCQCGLVWSSELDAVVANCGSDPLVAEEIPKITDEQMVANSDWIAESHNAWTAIAARLATLDEFAMRASEAQYLYDEQATLHSLSASVSWLESK